MVLQPFHYEWGISLIKGYRLTRENILCLHYELVSSKEHPTPQTPKIVHIFTQIICIIHEQTFYETGKSIIPEWTAW